jgi:hypothetical protein
MKCGCKSKGLSVKDLDLDVEQIQLKAGTYNLQRTRDGAGDSGPSLISLSVPEGARYHSDLVQEGGMGLLKKGNWVECGSIFPQSFSSSDWFRCTPITRFLEIEKDDDGEVIRVLFRTQNSEYEVKVF